MIAKKFKELGRRFNELNEKLEVLFIIFKNLFLAVLGSSLLHLDFL